MVELLRRSFSPRERGDVGPLGAVIGLFLVCIMIIAWFTPTMVDTTVSASIDRVESAGYTILSPADLATLNTKLDNLKTSADAAVVAAQAAVVVANTTLTTLLLHNENEVFLWPATLATNVTFTAGAVNTWSAWTEIVDYEGNKFSAVFATRDGYITELMFITTQLQTRCA